MLAEAWPADISRYRIDVRSTGGCNEIEVIIYDEIMLPTAFFLCNTWFAWTIDIFVRQLSLHLLIRGIRVYLMRQLCPLSHLFHEERREPLREAQVGREYFQDGIERPEDVSVESEKSSPLVPESQVNAQQYPKQN